MADGPCSPSIDSFLLIIFKFSASILSLLLSNCSFSICIWFSSTAHLTSSCACSLHFLCNHFAFPSPHVPTFIRVLFSIGFLCFGICGVRRLFFLVAKIWRLWPLFTEGQETKTRIHAARMLSVSNVTAWGCNLNLAATDVDESIHNSCYATGWSHAGGGWRPCCFCPTLSDPVPAPDLNRWKAGGGHDRRITLQNTASAKKRRAYNSTNACEKSQSRFDQRLFLDVNQIKNK